ncbi:MAG: zinc-ribbon domain-containing protein [Saccharofermentans sp.]|nr:zinc-ribbon domain-containing protein [Saccharofermentans sp.]
MFCPNCGTQNADGTSFCSNCGAPLTPNVNQAPAAPVAPAPQPVYSPNQAPVTAIPPKDNGMNGLCMVGFIISLVSILLGGSLSLISLILCIIGIISAGKKNQRGKGQALAGIIISAVLVLIWIFVFIFGIGRYMEAARDARSRYEPTRRTTEYEETTRRTTRETTEETTSEETTEETTRRTTRETTEETTAGTSETESKRGYSLTSVGNAKTGKVALTEGKWVTFIEEGGFSKDVIEHEQAKDVSTGSIIGLFVLDVSYDAETLGKSQMASMEQAGAKKITGARVKLGGYDAIQCYGTYPDGVILVVWFFKGDDGLMRKITVEFPSTNTKAFSLVEKSYKLDR